MYEQSIHTSKHSRVQRKTSHTYSNHHAARGSTSPEQERVRLLQLTICLLLFFAVFIGKGVFPEKTQQVRDDIWGLIRSDIDFRAAFSQLGAAISEHGAAFEDLGKFYTEVFGVKESEGPGEQSAARITKPENILQQEVRQLAQLPDATALSDHYLYSEYSAEQLPMRTQRPTRAEVTEPEPGPAEAEPVAVPAAGTLLLKANYDGKSLPANYTMDQLSLGELETVTPVLGRLNSEYGYRDHPISGKYLFHGGVDISGHSGDPIAAFADGTVEYVGKNNSYGLYLQLDHGNGVKSFYAHCKTICVSKGTVVLAGEKIAEVGSTGTATGPHLHLELKYENLHLDPAYYIEFQANA